MYVCMYDYIMLRHPLPPYIYKTGTTPGKVSLVPTRDLTIYRGVSLYPLCLPWGTLPQG